MFERVRDGGSFSEVPISESSWRARLNPNRAPAWPNPEASVGRRCCQIGDQIFWEIIDPGRTKLAALEVDIQKFLNDHNEHLKERESSNIGFSLFMTGKHERISCPTLVVISTNKKSRRRVVESIRNSKILDKYEGVLLAQSSRHPRYPDSGPAQYIAFGSEKRSSRTHPSGMAVYIKSSTVAVRSGTLIYIPVDPYLADSSPFRRATLGGILELIKEDGTKSIVGMTVAHAFEGKDLGGYASDQSEASENDMFEFEFEGPTPDDVFDDDGRMRFPSRFPSSRTTRLSSHRPLESLNDTSVIIENVSRLTILGVLMRTSLKSRHNLDWALVEITAKELVISNVIPSRGEDPWIEPIRSFSRADKDIMVATCTGSKGSHSGTMSGSSTFLKLKYSDTFEEVKTVSLDGTLSQGDSGSWIIEKNSGKLCGHIVAGDTSTGLAYIIPARVVFEQIERTYHCRLELPERDYLLLEDINERMSQVQLSPSNMEGVPEETERNAQARSVPPSMSHQMTSVTSFYPQSSSQPSAGYQQSQVHPPQPRYGQPWAGYQQQTQEYTSSKYQVPRAASVADPRMSTPYDPAAKTPIVEADFEYGNPQESRTMYPSPVHPGVAGPSAESARSQYSTKPIDALYDGAGPYDDRYLYHNRIIQESSSYDKVTGSARDPIASSSSSENWKERDRGRDRDIEIQRHVAMEIARQSDRDRDRDREGKRQREMSHDRNNERRQRREKG